jgi:alpha-L-rhamnosidase
MRSLTHSVSSINVTDLKTELLESPLGVENHRPHLSWRIEADRRGLQQRAYRIEVSSRAEALAAGHADLWDSGRVTANRSVGIPYGGTPLSSRQRCFWRVQTWDERDDQSPPSAAAWWEMGLLEPSDWSAQWLAAEDRPLREDRESGLKWVRGPAVGESETTQFRRAFSTATAAEVTFFVAAYGEVHIWVDDEPVEMPPLAASLVLGPRPASEVTVTIPAGQHVLAVALGMPDPRLAVFHFPAGEMAPFVRIRAADGGTQRLNSARWKSSRTAPSGWQRVEFNDGSWDDAPVVQESRREPWPKQPAFLLRRPFEAANTVTRARLYGTALGAYELYLNGERVGDALLTPESTNFSKRVLYRAYDVTALIRHGNNVLGAEVGDGWYASYTVIAGRYAWGPPPRRVLAQLELTYVDGSREVIATGPGWQLARSPIIASEIYDGEYYDARLEQPGWSYPGFDGSQWELAQVAPAPSASLVAHVGPPIRRKMVMSASTLTQPLPGVFVFDFGQNFAGWGRLRVSGPAGAVVEMRFAELLADSGEVDQSNLRMARQTDTYVLKGDVAGETFEPHFTYHGFRYVQLSGFPGVPDANDLKGIVVHSDLALTGELDVAQPLIQRLWENTLWSQRSNFVGIPTDCPQRDERLGWLGDANVFWDAAAFNMDVTAFTRRFMADVRDSQADNGAFSEFSPAAYRDPSGAGGAWKSVNNVNATGEIGAAPGWADAGVCLPWMIWQHYDDTAIIEENWSSMARYLEFIVTANPDHVWRHGRGADYGDWLALDAKSPGDPTTPKDLIGTTLWAHSLDCMAQMAKATGRAEEARSYLDTWVQVASAFESNFIAADGTVGNDSQTGYILALRYRLVPVALRAAAAARLVADIERRGTLLSTGFLGTPNSLDALADAGYGELVYSLLLRAEFPSWGYMVAKGATTIWERWNGDSGEVAMNSFNHYALGAVCGFIFRRIAGIAPLEPGFRKIEVRPLLDSRLRSGGGVYKSIAGKIATRWNYDPGHRFDLDLTVPPNSSAEVHLPATLSMTLMEGGQAVGAATGVHTVRRLLDSAVIEVGSGRYQFSVVEP